MSPISINSRESELRKALATTGSGSNLIAEDLEPRIRDYLMYTSPLTRAIPLITANGKTHEIVKRTGTHRGWFEGESTDPSYGQSTYARRSTEIKIVRVSGKVTDFMASSARSFTDAVGDELSARVEDFADILEFASMYGMDDSMDTYEFTGDAYQYTGVLGWILEDDATNNIYDANDNAAAGATVTLSMLDKMYAKTVGKYRNFSRDPYLWLMSQDMIDKVSGLQSRIQRQVPQVEFEGGMVMTTYKNIPILPSQFCAPASSTASPTNLAATTASGGDLDDDTYYYRVAAVTLYGEQVAAAEVNATTSGTHNSVTLSWTADANAKLYMIYKGLATGDNNLTLLDIIAAKSYDSDGKVSGNVTSYTDDGSVTNSVANFQPLDENEETVWLVNLGTDYGASRPVLAPTNGSPVDAFLRYEPIPVPTDEIAFRLKSYHALQVPRGESCVVLRRAKAS